MAKKKATKAKKRTGKAAAKKTVRKAPRKPVGRRPAARKRPTKSMDPEAMMAAWRKAATPAESHRRLDPLVGTFATKTTFTMDPGAPPHVSEGTSVHRWVLGGRYLEQVYRGSSMGMPFEGLGYTGYDNVQGKYIGTWMDTFGTGLMNSVGIGKPSGEALDFAAVAIDPTGKRVTFTCKVRIQNHDRHTYEMWTKAPNGKTYRTMLVEYTRKQENP